MIRLGIPAEEKATSITRWLGLNENPDGDSLLKLGEAADMRNFRITRDGILQKRPGFETVHAARSWTGPIRGIWHGMVGTAAHTLFAAGGRIYSYSLTTNLATEVLADGATFTDDSTAFFGFGGKVYAMNGHEFLEWDGSMPVEGGPTVGFDEPAGYRPLIATAAPPTGGGTLLEGVNKLNGLRRIRFSPTGAANIFVLPERGLTSVDYVKNTATGTNYTVTTDYTVDLTAGTVTFIPLTETKNGTGSATSFTLTNASSISGVSKVTVGGVTRTDWLYNANTGILTFGTAPASGTNNISITEVKTSYPLTGTNTLEIAYTFPTDYREQVAAMKCAELYNGAQDSRVFIYGDGSNQAFYSGLDDNGKGRADYWPDLNVLSVGDANTPITGLSRHYSSLAIFKSNSAYIANYGQITLASGALTAAFYLAPMNKTIGNTALGQVQLVDNSPRTLFNAEVYEWRNNASYSSNLTTDERQAARIGDRVTETLSGMDLSAAFAFDDNERQEYYIMQGGTALVHNYAENVWYKYTEYDFSALFAANGNLYGCKTNGDIVLFSRDYHSDNGAAIDCYWRSGSMAFGADYLRKYSGVLFVSVKPESLSSVNVTLMTNRKSLFGERTITYSFPTFEHADFSHWGFTTNNKPQTTRVKLKAKKFTYYQLVFETSADWNTTTILSADIKLRFGGDVK